MYIVGPKTRRRKAEAGFTLLEVMIALTIMVVGALGVFALMNRTVYATQQNRQSIISINLAREGIEIARSLRDASALGFGALVNGNWIVDSSAYYSLNTAADSSNVSNCYNCLLYLNGGRYTHTSGGFPVGIRRLVNIANGSSFACGGACEKIVTVRVQHPNSADPYVLVAHITDWR